MSNTELPQPDSEHEEALFAAALQRPASERAAFLDGACHGDAVLRARLKALLAADEQPNELLNDLAEGAAPTMRIEFVEEMKDESVGGKIGRYKILEKVGEGGCGVVYVAEQTEPVRRRVALKVIKLGMDTREVVARFEAERQALAMMDHPNIAKVLDAGSTETGRPYFVMELVRGIRINDYCDLNNLSTRERLDLFIKVCSAIQHAHQKGIIHRDIKPSNILVTLHDGVPVPKVIDFGIAKATEGRLTDATVYTQLQQFIGTPAYMSPEQAEMSGLDIDTRSDIYSLGVLLYELLAGSTPFDAEELMAEGIDALRKTIREKDPVRPSTKLATLKGEELTATAKRRSIDVSKLASLLRGDLDWIVMKCLEKDRKRRYDTANGLALDLQRYLRNEVVIARPPTTAYLLAKLIKRNKPAVAAGCTVVLALMVGFAAAVWQANRAQKEATRAKLAEQQSAAALDELRASAPAFAEQARALAAKEQFSEAIDKLDYAIKLRPDAAEYLVAKADLLRCQLKLAEAVPIYREASRVKPGFARAEASAKLCDELLAAPLSEAGKLTRESLAKLHLAMQQQQRPAAELMPVARLLGEEKKLLLDYWLARLKDLPVSAEKPLKERLMVREDGLLALDLSGTKITDLAVLSGMPLGRLSLDGCDQITDFEPLRGYRFLKALFLRQTKINNLSPLAGLPLEYLAIDGTRIFDISALRGMKLKHLSLRHTRVSDLSPLAGMPLTDLDTSNIPAIDYSPLAGAPLETCFIQNSPVRDLSFLRDSPLKRLTLIGSHEARGFAVLAGLKSLDLLNLPESFRNLPKAELTAIEALRHHPTLRNIETAERRTGVWPLATAQPKDDFWKAWDSERAMTKPLSEGGFKYTFTLLQGGFFKLEIKDQPLRDLSFLKGAHITELSLPGTAVADLRPLAGLALTFLDLRNTPVTDLTPLRGLPLKKLSVEETEVTDISPLQGMRLETFRARRSRVADLTALKGMPLNHVTLGGSKVTDLKPLHGMPIRTLELFGLRISDLSLLRGMPLEDLWVGNYAGDLAFLRGMPLRKLKLHDCAAQTDFSPLAESKELASLTLPAGAANLDFLRTFPNLERIGYREDWNNGGRPDRTAAEFWKEYDAKKAESRQP